MDEFHVFLIAALIVHVCLTFFDFIFKTCSFGGYIWLLQGTGLRVAPLRLHWFTSSLNRTIQKWSSWRPRIQLAWFSAGVWVTAALMPLAIIMIVHSVYQAVRKTLDSPGSVTSADSPQLLVQPIIPGWNLPTADFGYYILSLLICSVIHELGHAMAAVREDGRLLGLSLSLYYVLPVAMTHVDRLDPLPALKQLRILCAGVWNNVFVALIAAILATLLPWLVYPFYDFGVGVQVTDIKQGYGLDGATGLSVGDRIVRINNCQVYETISWQDCLIQVARQQQPGFCIPDSFIKEHDESVPAKHLSNGVVECCARESEGSNVYGRLCFEYLEMEGEPLPLPQHSCLAVRSVVNLASNGNSPPPCYSAQHCVSAGEPQQSLHCFVPSLDNVTKLLVMERVVAGAQAPPTPPILYLGHPYTAHTAVSVTEFIALYNPWLPAAIPETLLKLFTFISTFSLALALLNVVPCFYLDGQGITCCLVDLLLEKRVPHASVRHAVGLSITALGTLLLAVYIIVMFFIYV